MRYEEIKPAIAADAEASLAASDFEMLAQQVVAISLHAENPGIASAICAKVARVTHTIARGNALLGFGHLARRFRTLDRSLVEPLVRAGLADPDPYVRSQANAAADDLASFLGWQIRPRIGA